MVRSNLVYVFQNQQRLELQEALDNFEKKYFSYQAKQNRPVDDDGVE